LGFISLLYLALRYIGGPLARGIIQDTGIFRLFSALFQLSLGGIWLRQHRNLSPLVVEHAFGADNASRRGRHRCRDVLFCGA
jgi:hypothetical protein